MTTRAHSLAPILAAVGAALALSTPADAIVVAGRDPMARPDHAWIGSWNGSTAVAIAPSWILTAKHVGGFPGLTYTIQGESFVAAEVIPHPTLDVELIRVDGILPGFHRLGDQPQRGDLVVLGGMGVTAGADFELGGYDWTGPRGETWGANTVAFVGTYIGITFDAPGSEGNVPHEGIFAVNDSGGGLFTVGADGELELTGIAVSVFGWGASAWGTTAFSLSVTRWGDWAREITGDPDAPLASSVVAPPLEGQ